jgi:hypothetical protein
VRFASFILGIVCILAAPLARADSPVLVELFTSQGCSSCPPADALLRRLDADPNIIALALHVDYWDYLGWRDLFADPRHSDRQRAYARAAGHRSIYTPQIVVQGDEQVVGTDERAVLHAVQSAAERPGTVAIDLLRRTGEVHIRITGSALVDAPCLVQVVEVVPRETVEILRGENAGRLFEYRNIVRDWRPVGHWDGTAPWTATVPVSADRSIVVLVQEAGPGAVLAAARLR